ncbi:cyclic GMP-AMP synthase-like receptor, partial [Vespula squamosa]
IRSCEHSGFIKIHSGLNKNKLINLGMDSREMNRLLDDDMYIDQNKFRSWMESIVTKTILNLLEIKDNRYLLKINNNEYIIRIIKSGPAFTFEVEFMNGKTINIDLVPVLEFSKDVPNMHNLSEFKTFQKQNWFAVPKPVTQVGRKCICWRTCFYEQEKEILSKNGQIKQIIRLVKKLRDTRNWKNIASYYIETIALHLLQDEPNFGKRSCTLSFMQMLCYMQKTLINRCLYYYWNNRFNLLDKLHFEEVKNISNKLGKIIKTINESIENNPYIIAFHILNTEEYKQFLEWLNKQPSEIENNEYSRCILF